MTADLGLPPTTSTGTATPDTPTPDTAPTGTATTSTGTATTSTAPTLRALWRRVRAPLGVLAALVLLATLLAVLSTSRAGLLDPQSYSPDGSRAVATLLEDRGVPVRVVRDLPALRAELGYGSTVLAPRPGALTAEELGELSDLDAPLVVTGAGPEEVEALHLPVQATRTDLEVRQPACALPAARRAGTALVGRVAYTSGSGARAVGCYATGGRAALLELPAERTTLLGAADPLTHDQLDAEGNAALALGLLGSGDEVLWLLPAPGRAGAQSRTSIGDLLPDAVLLGALQLVVAVVVLALWRARRLGRVVEEPLPVVVRAAEAVEGRARLYRAARARDAAAEALRSGARDRLVRRLGLPPDADRSAISGAVAARTARDPAAVDSLLYGAAPSDDAALVRLAYQLDALASPSPTRPLDRDPEVANP